MSALGQREAIAFGDGVILPVRIKFDELPAHAMPRNSSARCTGMWQKPVGDEGFLDSIVERWRNASAAAADKGTERGLGRRKRQPAGECGGAARPAVCADRRPRSHESHGERRDFAALRRESGVAAAPPAKPGSAVRAMGAKLHQR